MVGVFLMRYGYFLIIPICFILSSCGPRYQPKSLDYFSYPPSFSACHDDITVSISPLSKKEANAIFDQRGGRLMQKKKSTQLVLFTVSNNRINPLVLSKEHISNTIIPASDLVEKMYAHSTRRVIGTLGLGLLGASTLFLTATYVTIIGVVGAIPALIKTGYGLLGASGLLFITGPVGSYVQSQNTTNVNKIIHEDASNKLFNGRLQINPNETKKIIIAFDKKLFTPIFTIRFTDEVTKQRIPFHVDLGGKNAN
jgi:hypothetical protein